MLLQKQLLLIRNRWHPLWRLRQWPFYRYVQEKIDFTSFITIPETSDKIAVRFLRDFSWIINPTNIEPEIRDTFKLILRLLEPKTFWDIGANIGFYSWFVKQSSSINEIVLFEPDPINYSLLQKTIKKNSIKNCSVLNVAVSDQVGQVNFVIDQASGTTGSLESTAQIHDEKALHFQYGMGKSITCQTVTIDSLIDKTKAPDFIKIDVEGAEHLVIKGATNCLTRYKPTLIIETNNEELIHKLHLLHYTIYQIDKENYLFVSNSFIKENLIIKNLLAEYTLSHTV